MQDLAAKLALVNHRIRAAEKTYRRPVGGVRLLAVSKSHSSEKLMAIVAAGQIDFGENYVQEALAKMALLKQYSLQWHFIGRIQANKTRAIAENFAWAHGLCQVKIAARLNQRRPANLPPLNVCIQVNVSGEASKQGVQVASLLNMVDEIRRLDRLKLRGLMVIPAYVTDFARQREIYHQVADLQYDLIARGYALDTLSMGMSHDFVAAVAEGSTMVRVGTAIFGERTWKKQQ